MNPVNECAKQWALLYDTPVSDEMLTLAYDVIRERYELVAHRKVPPKYKTLVSRLVAIWAILEARGIDAFERLQGKEDGDIGSSVVTSGAVRSISIGDTSTTFASSSGSNLGEGGSDGTIDQSNELMRDFTRLWRGLIANTRRLV